MYRHSFLSAASTTAVRNRRCDEVRQQAQQPESVGPGRKPIKVPTPGDAGPHWRSVSNARSFSQQQPHLPLRPSSDCHQLLHLTTPAAAAPTLFPSTPYRSLCLRAGIVHARSHCHPPSTSALAWVCGPSTLASSTTVDNTAGHASPSLPPRHFTLNTAAARAAAPPPAHCIASHFPCCTA